jgi:L-idonate 5-dehydrogenase
MTEVDSVVAHGAHDLRVQRTELPMMSASEVEVAPAVGGICGSDLHYFHDGGVGDFTIREPLVLGHEIAGTVTRIGGDVIGLPVGTRVAIDPSRPCGTCESCRRGERNLCTDGRFLGSAARTPHVQGGFRRRIVVGAAQCVALPDDLNFADAVFAEPLAVAFPAVGRGGPLLGRRVLVTGAGPIGALIVLAAHRAGAAEITVTDVLDAPLAFARRLGAHATVNVAEIDGDGVIEECDVAFEASGAPAALPTCAARLRPGGRLVLVGLLPPGLVPAPGNRVVTRELDVVGSFRFVGAEFRAALDALATGLDVSALLTGRFGIDDAVAAFETASRREESMKVQIVFDGS